MKKHYIVTWEIDIWDISPQRAAKQALEIQRDKEGIATVFIVRQMGSPNSFTVDITEGTITCTPQQEY